MGVVLVSNTTAQMTGSTPVVEEASTEPHFESFIDLDEMAAPGSPGANVGRIYVADDGGTTIEGIGDAAAEAARMSERAFFDNVIAFPSGAAVDGRSSPGVAGGPITINISVHGSTDARATAREVAREIQRTLENRKRLA